ncbi:MAG TPA: hypothetical protein VM077_01875 [Candidatus Limnocylindrales bacterium]|nr:hypothetical protein [Candidatus Limnocylindrales bacterium]
MNVIKKFLPLVVIVILSYWSVKPLFQTGFFPIHDDEQVGRLYDLHIAVQSGHLPPRLSQNLGYGYDYPLFNFYPSFIYYIAEIYHLFGFSYISSIKLMIASGFILAAFAMYALSKEYFGKLAGVISALIYTYAPYRSIDAYVRGALPEFWSFVFLPAIFWSFTKLAKTPGGLFTVISGIFLAFFVLTHNLIAMMSIPFILCFLIYLYFTTTSKKQFVLTTVYSGIIGICLSAYFWLPAILEKQYTMVSILTTELADYAIHFVYPVQFLYSPWGYGGSAAGTHDGLSFQIGKIYLFCLIAVSIYAFMIFKKQRKIASLLFLLLGLFIFSLFMQVSYSKFVWDALQSSMSYIQFPWRYLVFSFFLASFAIGALFATPFSLNKKKSFVYVQYILGAFIICGVLYKAVTIFNPSEYLLNVKDNDYISQDIMRWKTSNMAFEYVPRGIITKKSARGNTVVDIKKTQIAKAPLSVISGNMNIKVIKDIPQEKSAMVNVKKNGILQFNVYTFPGWKVYIDGKYVPYSANNSFRLLQIPMAEGTHKIVAVFQDTFVRSLGNMLSGMMALGIVFYTSYSLKNWRKKQ